MPAKPRVSYAYQAALAEIARRIADSLQDVAPEALPIRMYIAGGAALHFYTGERVSSDIDAAFSHRIALPDDLEVAYQGDDGAAALLYFDRNYNDTLALLHEDAYDDARAVALPGVDAAILDVRLLTPLDLAISKLSRFASQDRDDIMTLARLGLIDASQLRQRAEEALGGYIGDLARLRTSIDIACRQIADDGKQPERH